MQDNKTISKMIYLSDRILNYVGDSGRDEFYHNDMLVDACVFNLSQIGELTKNVSDDLKFRHQEIDWTNIYGLRNRIDHDYDGVNFTLIWQIISEDLPQLIKDLKNILCEMMTSDGSDSSVK